MNDQFLEDNLDHKVLVTMKITVDKYDKESDDILRKAACLGGQLKSFDETSVTVENYGANTCINRAEIAYIAEYDHNRK